MVKNRGEVVEILVISMTYKTYFMNNVLLELVDHSEFIVNTFDTTLILPFIESSIHVSTSRAYMVVLTPIW